MRTELPVSDAQPLSASRRAQQAAVLLPACAWSSAAIMRPLHALGAPPPPPPPLPLLLRAVKQKSKLREAAGELGHVVSPQAAIFRPAERREKQPESLWQHGLRRLGRPPSRYVKR